MDFDAVERAIAAVPAAQGYLAVSTERGERAYFLGPRSVLDGEVPMLDWRTSPLGEAFFRHAPGEAYEIEAAGERTAVGRVVARCSYRALPARSAGSRSRGRRQGGGDAPRRSGPGCRSAALPVLIRSSSGGICRPTRRS